MTKAEQLSKQYQKKTDKQHVLDNPDTYIGSIEQVDTNIHVFNDETKIINEKEINMIPGLYKLFDEGIVNCRDHAVRMERKIYDAQLDCLPVLLFCYKGVDGCGGFHLVCFTYYYAVQKQLTK